MESSQLQEGDVAIGISHSGTNRNVIECLKNARTNGATTIGLTTYGKSPLLKQCDHVLMTSTKETIFKSESVTARIAQLAVIDSLVAIMSLVDYDKAYDAIQKTRNATADRKF
jgi:DNA-binding MurR/RpiR family transcriptional regulator